MELGDQVNKRLVDLESAISDLNTRYPRPGIPALSLSDEFLIPEDCVEGRFPNADLPGVYAFLDHNQELLYIGSSIGLGRRLGDGYIGRVGEIKDAKIKGAKSLRTIGVPKEHFFEAMAIEAFLIRELAPPRNTNLK